MTWNTQNNSKIKHRYKHIRRKQTNKLAFILGVNLENSYLLVVLLLLLLLFFFISEYTIYFLRKEYIKKKKKFISSKDDDDKSINIYK